MYSPVAWIHCSLHTVNSFTASSFVAANCKDEQKWQDEWSKWWLTKYGKRNKKKKKDKPVNVCSWEEQIKKCLSSVLWRAHEFICSHAESIITAEHSTVKRGIEANLTGQVKTILYLHRVNTSEFWRVWWRCSKNIFYVTSKTRIIFEWRLIRIYKCHTICPMRLMEADFSLWDKKCVCM